MKSMRALVLLLAASTCLAAEDAAEIVRRSVNQVDTNSKRARDYTFLERAEQKTLDGTGRVKQTETVTHDITLLEGSPYRRLVARNDKPLSPKEEQKEQEKLRKITEQRRKETPEQRAQRLADWEHKRERERAAFREVADAFTFRLLGEETLADRKLWVIEATPRPGYKPRLRNTRFFPKVKGKIWIDEQDYVFVKAEAETIDTISIGAILVRLAKGSRLVLEQARINGEVWLPKRIEASGSARVALVKKYQGAVEITYRNYRKFQVDSRVVAAEPVR